MNIEQRKQRSSVFLDAIYDTLIKKGNDYAATEDCFTNFRNTATTIKVPVEKVFLGEIVKKVSRIVELLEKEAKCESLADSVLDIAGYACLLDSYLFDRAQAQDQRTAKERKQCEQNKADLLQTIQRIENNSKKPSTRSFPK